MSQNGYGNNSRSSTSGSPSAYGQQQQNAAWVKQQPGPYSQQQYPQQQQSQYGQYAYGNMPPYGYEPYPPGKGMGTASLVLGIFSLAFLLITLPILAASEEAGAILWIISLILGIMGIILGAVARGRLRPYGQTGAATGGLVCSIISLSIGVFLLILGILVDIGVIPESF